MMWQARWTHSWSTVGAGYELMKEEQALREALQFPPCRGRRGLKPNALQGVEPDVTVLSACQQCRKKRPSGGPSATPREAEPRKCEAVQATGRVSPLSPPATPKKEGCGVGRRRRTSSYGVPFTSTSREVKVSEAVTSVGTSQGCYADEDLTCDYSGCADRLRSACFGRPVPVLPWL